MLRLLAQARKKPNACWSQEAGCIRETRRRSSGGRLKIKGRIKDIIVTSTGEKISPADLEQAIAGRSALRAGDGDRRATSLHRRPRRHSTVQEAEREAPRRSGSPAEMGRHTLASSEFHAFALNRIRASRRAFPGLCDAAPGLPDCSTPDRCRRPDDADAEAQASGHRTRLRRGDRGDVRERVNAGAVGAQARRRAVIEPWRLGGVRLSEPPPPARAACANASSPSQGPDRNGEADPAVATDRTARAAGRRLTASPLTPGRCCVTLSTGEL